jgi:pyruvate formate lyase activating enzyme
MENKTIQLARLQRREGEFIQCLTCERRCKLKEGGLGWCRTRRRQGDQLFVLNYGAVSSLSANPVEKKPFYHFYPGSRAMTVGSWSCNFGCPWCQNYSISKVDPPPHGKFISPESFIEITLDQNCEGTSISFNEPTLSFEWCLDMFPLAHQAGLYNTFVTNGYMTPEALEQLAQAGLDAMNIDVKGTLDAVRRYCRGVDQEKVWARCRQALHLGIHLEITTLVVTGVNDSRVCLEQIADRISEELGIDTPWHVSAYLPAYLYDAPATSPETLEMAYQIGRNAGLNYVYVGNEPGSTHVHTYCPNCGQKLIDRHGFELLENRLADGHCPHCERQIYGHFIP